MMKRSFQCVALAAVSLIAARADAAQQSYLVQLTLKQGETLIASPKMLVLADQPARAAASTATGASYDVSLSVSSRDGPAYLVKLALDSRSAGGSVYHAKPSALIEAGETAGLTISPSEGPATPINVGLTVTPVDDGANR